MLSDHPPDLVLWGFALALLVAAAAAPCGAWWSDLPWLGAASVLGGWLGLVASRMDG